MKTKVNSINIKVNDIFDELLAENKRLLNELLFSQKCLNVLNKIKIHLNLIHNKYENIIDSEDKQLLNELTEEYKQTIETNEEIVVKSEEKISELSEDLNNKSNEESDEESNDCKSDEKSNDLNEDTNQSEGYLPKNEIIFKMKSKINLLLNKTSKTTFTQNISLRNRCFDLKTKSYKCPESDCNQYYSIKHFNRFIDHINNCHSIYFCEFSGCGRSFKGKTNRDNHSLSHTITEQTVNILNKPFACDRDGCDFQCRQKLDLIIHKSVHNKNRLHKCRSDGCDKRFKSIQLLKSHEFYVHRNVKPFVCTYDYCDKSFNFSDQLEEHSAIHKSEPTLKCSSKGCEELFFTSQDIYKHKISDHNLKPIKKGIPKRLSCDWPGCEYKGKDLKEHKRIHTGDKPLLCDFPDCGKSFRYRTNLINHKRIHLTDKPFACHWPGCQNAFKASDHLKRHISVHSDERPFLCDWPECDKRFKYKNALNLHTLGHKNINPFVCEWPGCESKFRYLVSLKRHKLFHLNEYPFYCDFPECGKQFRVKQHLILHKNIHNLGKSYACHWPGCQFKFYYKSSLSKHIRKVHKK